MLPAVNRLRDSERFGTVVRHGRRARSATVVVHQQAAPAATEPVPHLAAPEPVVGLIVSKAVGGSVVRHRVSRRLRAQLSSRLALLPAGSATVVRALPEAAAAQSAVLAADLDRALHRLARTR